MSETMDRMAGIGQQSAESREVRNVREVQERSKTEKTREIQEEREEKEGRQTGEEEEKSALWEPRFDEYVPEKKLPEEKDGAEKYTINTDKVDAEIRRLKEKKVKLERQLDGAEEGTDTQKRLREQLEQTERELLEKDNDTYRRQNSKSGTGHF